MSHNYEDMVDRINSLQAYWRDRGIPALQGAAQNSQELIRLYKDPFANIMHFYTGHSIKMPDPMYQATSKIIQELRDNPQFPESMKNKGGIFDTMDAILKGDIRYAPMKGQELRNMPTRPRRSNAPLDNPPEVKKPKITLFSRNTRHKEFMKGINKDVEGLRTWLENFYCTQYLQGDEKDTSKQEKANKILTHLRIHHPPADMTIEKYLNDFGFPSLVTLIGANRQSKSNKKVPWGLEKISEAFGYQIKPADIRAKLREPKGSRDYISL